MRSGMHHVSLALADHLKAVGGEIRTSAGVEKILVSSGRAAGVRRREVVGSEIAGRMKRYEWGDSALVIYAALDGPVEYKAGPEAGAATHVHLTPPSLDPVARASVESRGGELPATSSSGAARRLARLAGENVERVSHPVRH